MSTEQSRSLMPEAPESPKPAAVGFLRQSRFRLREDYLVKITAALEEITEEQLWWRPNEASNSAGNLLLHLSGNVRQWILAGVAGQKDVRDRASEFTARSGRSKAELLELLTATLDEVDAALDAIEKEAAASDAPLQRICHPQRYTQSVLDAVYHVVEHFSYHTGQIVYIAKLLAGGERIRMYDEERLNR
jgi:uncharacterized damage-inducible protein DinB